MKSKPPGPHPYLTGIGSNKSAVHDYKIVIDGKILDTGTSCMVNAFDILLKANLLTVLKIFMVSFKTFSIKLKK